MRSCARSHAGTYRVARRSRGQSPPRTAVGSSSCCWPCSAAFRAAWGRNCLRRAGTVVRHLRREHAAGGAASQAVHSLIDGVRGFCCCWRACLWATLLQAPARKPEILLVSFAAALRLRPELVVLSDAELADVDALLRWAAWCRIWERIAPAVPVSCGAAEVDTFLMPPCPLALMRCCVLSSSPTTAARASTQIPGPGSCWQEPLQLDGASRWRGRPRSLSSHPPAACDLGL